MNGYNSIRVLSNRFAVTNSIFQILFSALYNSSKLPPPRPAKHKRFVSNAYFSYTLLVRQRKRLTFTIVTCLLILAIGAILLSLHSNRDYSNPSFLGYKNNVISCASFYGGNHETDAQIYDQWKKHEPIGCQIQFENPTLCPVIKLMPY